MLDPNFVILGVIINFLGSLSYAKDTLKGKIKPNKVTYFMWSMSSLIAFAAQITQGVGIQSLLTLSAGIFPLFIFIASFLNEKAYWKLNVQDFICGILSFLGLSLWYITKVGNIAILFSILSEGLATLPTITKSYYYPETEKSWPWLASFIGGFLTVLTIENWNFAHYAFPLFYSFEMLLIFFFVQYKVGKLHK